MIAFLSLFCATFVSEDLACVSAGLLIGQGAIDPRLGVLACLAGIVVGDAGLWGLGRVFGRAVLSWPFLKERIHADRIHSAGEWLARHAATAIVTSRFLPGTRLPLYLAAGFVKLPLRVFVCWTTVGAALWTPAIVLLTAYSGVAVTAFLPSGMSRWMASVVGAVIVFATVRSWNPALAGFWCTTP